MFSSDTTTSPDLIARTLLRVEEEIIVLGTSSPLLSRNRVITETQNNNCKKPAIS